MPVSAFHVCPTRGHGARIGVAVRGSSSGPHRCRVWRTVRPGEHHRCGWSALPAGMGIATACARPAAIAGWRQPAP